jgi:hypothetical protein
MRPVVERVEVASFLHLRSLQERPTVQRANGSRRPVVIAAKKGWALKPSLLRTGWGLQGKSSLTNRDLYCCRCLAEPLDFFDFHLCDTKVAGRWCVKLLSLANVTGII